MTNKMTREHIGLWLKTNSLIKHYAKMDNQIYGIDETPSNVLKKSFESLIDVFGYKLLLLSIAKSANITQLTKMHEIIMQQSYNHIQHTHKQTDKINNKRITTVNTFPNECISHICGFLNKNDIKLFKLTSTQIGIVCIKEMSKISIGIYSTNINRIHSYFHNIHRTKSVLSLNKMVNYSRYNPK
eukprot:490153_1